jgi:hypothetical protein
MPVVSEESRRARRRNLWPVWVAASVLSLLVLGVGLLPLTGFRGRFGRVYAVFGDAPWDAPQGYLHLDRPQGSVHGVRIGSWYWGLHINQTLSSGKSPPARLPYGQGAF